MLQPGVVRIREVQNARPTGLTWRLLASGLLVASWSCRSDTSAFDAGATDQPSADLAWAPAPLAFADVLAACVAMSACLPGSVSARDCIAGLGLVVEPFYERDQQMTPDEVRCLAWAGNDCKQAARCMNLGVDPPPCAASHCEGDVLVNCHEADLLGRKPYPSRYDCGRQGLTCIPSTGLALPPTCGLPGCAHGKRCYGDTFYLCRADLIEVPVVCGWSGHCEPQGVGGHAACVGDGPACAGLNDPLRCEGNTLVVCTAGREARLDCTRHGEVCVLDPMQGPRCALGSGCAAPYVECEGAQLAICADGRRITVDCLAGGFRGCAADRLRCLP